MARSYDEAVATLYQTPHEAFVTERKRLAGELKAGGDREGATRLSKLSRPPVSAWAVNQLYWQRRDEFAALFVVAERLQQGDYDARSEHRELSASLRTQAAKLLTAGGHAPNEATLRRVSATLGALAAAGSFAPDPPGALANDRDPPGFEAWNLDATVAPKSAAPEPERPKPDLAAEKSAREAERATREAERVTREQVQRRERERQRVESALHGARREVETRETSVQRLRAELETAEQRLLEARDAAERLAAELSSLR